MVTRSAPATRRGKGRSHLREVRYGSFRRWFKPPAHVTSEAISASYDAGVLVKRTSADVLREARCRDSGRKRDHVFRTVDAMKQNGTPITFAAVARTKRPAAMRARPACESTSNWQSRTTADFAVRWTALRRSCGNDLVLNSMRRQLSHSGAESMNSPPLMIATGAKILVLQRNSMMRVVNSA